MVEIDQPITSPDQDRLGRHELVRNLAAEIWGIDTKSQGCVVGLLGGWGSGKTSLLNMLRAELATHDTPVLMFDPWLFSGANDLVACFFKDTAEQLLQHQSRTTQDLTAVATALLKYQGVLSALISMSPMGGPWAQLFQSVTSVFNQQKPAADLNQKRAKLGKQLSKLKKPIIVVVDDIDRLETEEIRDIFKLVRLTGNFPNIIYILAFDRFRVEQALSRDEPGLGRKYIEKIIQIAIDVPVIPDETIANQIASGLDGMIEDMVRQNLSGQFGYFDDDTWDRALFAIILPLIRNMRDLRKYIASVQPTLRALGGDMALVDILVLETVRLFLPETFSALIASEDILTASERSAADMRQLAAIITSAGDQSAVAQHLLDIIFLKRKLPRRGWTDASLHLWSVDYKSYWATNRRVFDRYLEARSSVYDGEQIYDKLGNPEKLDRALNEMERATRIRDTKSLIAGIRNHLAKEWSKDSYPPNIVVRDIVLLLKHLPAIKQMTEEEDGNMFTVRSDKIVVGRIIAALLIQLDDYATIKKTVEQCLRQIEPLTLRLLLILQLRSLSDIPRMTKLQATLENNLRRELAGCSTHRLATEPDPLRLLAWAKSSDSSFSMPNFTPELDQALLLDTYDKNTVWLHELSEVCGGRSGALALIQRVVNSNNGAASNPIVTDLAQPLLQLASSMPDELHNAYWTKNMPLRPPRGSPQVSSQ
ncbi:MAG TPA: P-loop NTPase fold protein [Candidatus Saccharimonadales bacterium]|nr:P-loop NTPase fold protein [Candidatus Saccharimonadales bacterium]